MNSRPDISVVMGVYNGARHLSQTMDSVLAQEGVDFELVVVDDGSTDASASLLNGYAKGDARVTVISQENQGLTRALINGCAQARGGYIARQDVGDLSAPRRLLLQKAALDGDPDVGFVSCWTEYRGPQWEFLYTVKGAGRSERPVSIISESEPHGVVDGPTCHPSVMFRKDLYEKVGGYRAEFYYGQDWDLWYRMGEASKFQLIGQCLYRVRVEPGGISSSNKKRQEELASLSLAALRLRRKALPEHGVLARARTIRPAGGRQRRPSSAAGLYFIGECLRRNRDARSILYFKQSIKDSPLYLKSWVRIIQAGVGSAGRLSRFGP